MLRVLLKSLPPESHQIFKNIKWYGQIPEQANIGNLRETFFMNQMRVNHNVVCSKISDFEIDGATFEIGGKKKGQKQIETAA